ncbi:hypothetical protein [Thermodesulforhabdus norvegica]|uniref:Uncharacterized protein n=1 Tax=Thermodesulforhabdus norvegica TaxID=39841 RepID=A0A1I4RBZ7_9BACT|nr:hypothetical protein [Thermodesulforhabdus norvegica]SFM49802.1 hypothetical protein SAMN05660836_00537 [Thermodesulforhabdus norvegica]
MTREGDVVLVYVENKPAFFARIEAITPDVKPLWFRVKMLILQIPFVVVTWILREEYINGAEFTMGGTPIRMERVEAPPEPLEDLEEEEDVDGVKGGDEGRGGKVVSLAELRKQKKKKG